MEKSPDRAGELRRVSRASPAMVVRAHACGNEDVRKRSRDATEGLLVWTAPHGIALCQTEVVADLR
jgi:hypothetical protein